MSTFLFEAKSTTYFGVLKRPIARVDLYNVKEKKWQNVTMIIDTGADITLLPSYLATLLDIDWKDLKKLPAQSVAGVHDVYLKPDLKVRLGKFERVIPVGFVRNRSIPPLLGRHKFLETFITTLQKDSKVTFAE